METVTTNTDGMVIKSTFEDDDIATTGLVTPVEESAEEVPTVEAELVSSDVLKTEDFINDENIDAFKFMEMNSRINDIQRLSENIISERNKFIGDEDNGDEIDKLLENYDEETIKNMTQEEFDEAFSVDGVPFEVNIEFDKPEDALAFKKDFLVFRKSTLTTSKELEEEMAKINAEIEASKEEFESIMNEYKNMTTLIRTSVKKKIEDTEDEEKKALYTDILMNFDDSFILNGFKNYLRSYKGKSVLSDYIFDKNSMSIYRKYMRAMKRMNIKDDLKNFTNVEKTYIGEEYAKRPNIVMFALMHYIASKSNQEDVRAFGVFVTQFIVNLKNLIFDKFDDANDKETFITSIKEVIDIIG